MVRFIHRSKSDFTCLIHCRHGRQDEETLPVLHQHAKGMDKTSTRITDSDHSRDDNETREVVTWETGASDILAFSDEFSTQQ